MSSQDADRVLSSMHSEEEEKRKEELIAHLARFEQPWIDKLKVAEEKNVNLASKLEEKQCEVDGLNKKLAERDRIIEELKTSQMDTNGNVEEMAKLKLENDELSQEITTRHEEYARTIGELSKECEAELADLKQKLEDEKNLSINFRSLFYLYKGKWEEAVDARQKLENFDSKKIGDIEKIVKQVARELKCLDLPDNALEASRLLMDDTFVPMNRTMGMGYVERNGGENGNEVSVVESTMSRFDHLSYISYGVPATSMSSTSIFGPGSERGMRDASYTVPRHNSSSFIDKEDHNVSASAYSTTCAACTCLVEYGIQSQEIV